MVTIYLFIRTNQKYVNSVLSYGYKNRKYSYRENTGAVLIIQAFSWYNGSCSINCVTACKQNLQSKSRICETWVCVQLVKHKVHLSAIGWMQQTRQFSRVIAETKCTQLQIKPQNLFNFMQQGWVHPDKHCPPSMEPKKLVYSHMPSTWLQAHVTFDRAMNGSHSWSWCGS